MRKLAGISLLLSGLFAFNSPAGLAAAAQDLPVRQPGEDVNSREVRQRQGLRPDKNLLFNGWGVTPAGSHTPVSDLALRLVVTPDKQRVVAVHGGYNEHGVSVLDLASRNPTQFLPLKEAWNGIAFNKEGSRFFVSGGDSGQIHIFSYTNGVAALERSVRPDFGGSPVFLAGFAIHPATGRLYVCNEANHETLVLDPESMAVESRVRVGLHPHTCVMGADHRHLYYPVSGIDDKNWRRILAAG